MNSLPPNYMVDYMKYARRKGNSPLTEDGYLDLTIGLNSQSENQNARDFLTGYPSIENKSGLITPTAPKPAPAPGPSPQPSPQPAPQPSPQPAPQPAPQPSPRPAPSPGTTSGTAPRPARAPQPSPQPSPRPAPRPAPATAIIRPYYRRYVYVTNRYVKKAMAGSFGGSLTNFDLSDYNKGSFEDVFKVGNSSLDKLPVYYDAGSKPINFLENFFADPTNGRLRLENLFIIYNNLPYYLSYVDPTDRDGLKQINNNFTDVNNYIFRIFDRKSDTDPYEANENKYIFVLLTDENKNPKWVSKLDTVNKEWTSSLRVGDEAIKDGIDLASQITANSYLPSTGEISDTIYNQLMPNNQFGKFKLTDFVSKIKVSKFEAPKKLYTTNLLLIDPYTRTGIPDNNPPTAKINISFNDDGRKVYYYDVNNTYPYRQDDNIRSDDYLYIKGDDGTYYKINNHDTNLWKVQGITRNNSLLTVYARVVKNDRPTINLTTTTILTNGLITDNGTNPDEFEISALSPMPAPRPAARSVSPRPAARPVSPRPAPRPAARPVSPRPAPAARSTSPRPAPAARR